MYHTFPQAYHHLEELEEAKSEAARLRRAVRVLEDRCTHCTSHYGFGGPGGGQTQQELMAELCDRREALRQAEENLRRLEIRVNQAIARLPKPRWRMVLRFHYLDGLSLPQVARELEFITGRPFSMSQIYRLHSAALKAVEEKIQDS